MEMTLNDLIFLHQLFIQGLRRVYFIMHNLEFRFMDVIPIGERIFFSNVHML